MPRNSKTPTHTNDDDDDDDGDDDDGGKAEPSGANRVNPEQAGAKPGLGRSRAGARRLKQAPSRSQDPKNPK